MTNKLTAAQLHGIFPAIPTPVLADDTIDAAATRALLRHLLPQGIAGVVPIGGTGEYGALARSERVRMVALCAEEAAGRVPVIPGVLDPGFHDALAAGKSFADAGADAVMVLTPYYTTPTQQGIRDYFMRYADASPHISRGPAKHIHGTRIGRERAGQEPKDRRLSATGAGEQG